VVSRFSPELIESRRKGLQKFVCRVANHEELRNVGGALSAFLTVSDEGGFSRFKADVVQQLGASSNGNDEDIHTSHEGNGNLPVPPKESKAMKWLAKATTSVTSTMSPVTVYVSSNDTQIQEMERYVISLESQLKNVVQHSSNLVKKGKEVANGLFEFGLAFTLLGQSETGTVTSTNAPSGATAQSSALGTALTQMGHTADTLSVLSAEQSEKELEGFEEPLTDYIRLLTSVRNAIGVRSSKRHVLSVAIRDLGTLQGNMAKIENVPGKEDKYLQLSTEVRAETSAVNTHKAQYLAIEERIIREFGKFQKDKEKDMRKTVLDYIQMQIEYNKRMEKCWGGLLPVLEGVGGDSGGSSGGDGGGDGGDRVRNNSEVYDSDLVGV